MGDETKNSFPQRKHIRLRDYDYSQNGCYFVTICTQGRQCVFSRPVVGNAVLVVPDNSYTDIFHNNIVLLNGEPISQEIKPPQYNISKIGLKTIEAWQKMSHIDDNIKTDLFCIMPNHIHGIIIIQNQEPDVSETERRGRRSLHDLVRAFKSVTTRQYNEITNDNMKNNLWQSSFYDHIIRNGKTLEKIRCYILMNPDKWLKDKYYVE